MKSVSGTNPVLKEGDKILQVEGTDIKSHMGVRHVISSLQALVGPFSMMISRQT